MFAVKTMRELPAPFWTDCGKNCLKNEKLFLFAIPLTKEIFWYIIQI